MTFSSAAIALSLLTLVACSHQPAGEPISQPTLASAPTHEPISGIDSPTPKKIKLVCSVPPAPKDTHKLKQNLKDKGVISADMSDEQADAKVAEYLYQRQQAFKNCNKGT